MCNYPLADRTAELYDLILAEPSSVFSYTVSLSFFSALVPSPFKVVPHVVHLVQSLRTDGLPTSKAFLLQFTELIHCMMYQYSGFPDLYDHILEAIKVRVQDASCWKCSHVSSKKRTFVTLNK